MYKVVGDTGKGLAWCGHTIKKNEPYFIERVGNELHSKCQECCKGYKVFKTVSPEFLEGLK